MSADRSSWDQELANLAGQLGKDGAIDPAQAEVIRRLAAEVSALNQGRSGQRQVVVRTAVALSPEERASFEKALARRIGAGRQAIFEVDPGVLGGVWLRVGDRIIDGSLRGRLEALRKQMNS